jgi:uncharacterized protein (TIGR03067 family)
MREGGMRASAVLLVVSAVLVGFAPAPLPRRERQREDPTDVDGKWALVLFERRGVRRVGAEKEFRAEVTRERFALIDQRGSVDEFVMSLNPADSPPSFIWCIGRQVAYVGSYRLRKDHLTMIFIQGESLRDRPTDFEGKAEFRFVLRRVRR